MNSLQPMTAERKNDAGTEGDTSHSCPAICSASFGVIYADPPWRYDNATPNRRIENHYPTMTIEEICALPVKEIAEDNAHLYLWTINKYVEQTYAVARAWGFEPSTLLVWAKQPMGGGLGGTYGISTEYILFCRRGSLPAKKRVTGTWWNWKRPYENGAPKHSAKPEAFQNMVESVSPGPYLEMFARRKRHGWAAWGNEIKNDVEIKT